MRTTPTPTLADTIVVAYYNQFEKSARISTALQLA
jgi:hypothetical protein